MYNIDFRVKEETVPVIVYHNDTIPILTQRLTQIPQFSNIPYSKIEVKLLKGLENATQNSKIEKTIQQKIKELLYRHRLNSSSISKTENLRFKVDNCSDCKKALSERFTAQNAKQDRITQSKVMPKSQIQTKQHQMNLESQRGRYRKGKENNLDYVLGSINDRKRVQIIKDSQSLYNHGQVSNSQNFSTNDNQILGTAYFPTGKQKEPKLDIYRTQKGLIMDQEYDCRDLGQEGGSKERISRLDELIYKSKMINQVIIPSPKKELWSIGSSRQAVGQGFIEFKKDKSRQGYLRCHQNKSDSIHLFEASKRVAGKIVRVVKQY